MKNNVKKLLILTILPLLASTSFSKDNAFNFNNLIKRASTGITPIMVNATFNGDAKTQIGITWHLDSASFKQTCEVVEESIGNFEDESAIKLSLGKGVSAEVNMGADDTGKSYKALVTGLKPNTKYIYRVGSIGNYSDVHSFKTSGTNEEFNFVHLSDPQGWSETDYVPGFNQTLSAAKTKNPALLALTGDIVDRAKEGKLNNAYKQWEWALESTKENLKDTILAPVSGNHETGTYQFSSRFNVHNVESDKGISGNYYSFTYNEVYFLCLNTNDTLNPTDAEKATGLSDEQMTFIKEDLKKNKDSKWKFVLMHKGLFDPGEHSSNKQFESGTYHDYDIDLIRKQLVPVFDEYHVDVVLQGHDHLFSRTFPTMKKDNSYVVGDYKETIKTIDGRNYSLKNVSAGTIYTNTSTASGSKYYDMTDYDESMMHFEKAEGRTPRMYTNYIVKGDDIFVDVYKIDSAGNETIYDSWGLTKTPIKEENEKPGESEDKPGESENKPNKEKSNVGLIAGISCTIAALIIAITTLIIIINKKKKGTK